MKKDDKRHDIVTVSGHRHAVPTVTLQSTLSVPRDDTDMLFIVVNDDI